MAARNVTFDMVRKIGLSLPDVEEGTMYGSPALKVHGRLLTCLAIHKSAEPASLVVRTDFDERAALLAEEPETYYLTDHYVNHPVVLVRLPHVREPITACDCAARAVPGSRTRPIRITWPDALSDCPDRDLLAWIQA